MWLQLIPDLPSMVRSGDRLELLMIRRQFRAPRWWLFCSIDGKSLFQFRALPRFGDSTIFLILITQLVFLRIA